MNNKPVTASFDALNAITDEWGFNSPASHPQFKDFAERTAKVLNQLMEGAITYEEFFNWTAGQVIAVLQSPEYAEFVARNPNGDPMGSDPANQ